jgi:hypothetical protein
MFQDAIKMPCPMQGCTGDVFAALEPMEQYAEWTILRFDRDPVVICSMQCSTPEALTGPVQHVLRTARADLAALMRSGHARME